MRPVPADDLGTLAGIVAECRLCPRLVAWREYAAAHPPRRFAGQRYRARPVPGFGDPTARVLVVGLAPAADGGNRTGRVFTGDRSGDFLFASLYRAGFASQPTSAHVGDGLTLRDLYITAVVKSAPPANRPNPDERDRCLPYLVRELELLPSARVVVALGAFAWNGFLLAEARLRGGVPTRPRPVFGHLTAATVGSYALVGSFHPSQQNTFTRKLTAPMLDAVFLRARTLAGLEPPANPAIPAAPTAPAEVDR